MDFIVGFLKTRLHHESILVLVDNLTKVAHFIPHNTTNDAPTIANKFAHEIFRMDGFPEVLISDRDSKFTYVFWKSLHKALDTKLNMSLAYHPKIDGKIECVNRILKDMVRMYCMEQKTK